MGRISTVPDDEFVRMFEAYGGTKTAVMLEASVRAVMNRRAVLEGKVGPITAPDLRTARAKEIFGELDQHVARLEFDAYDALILVGSDAHYWPGDPTPAHRAFVRACKTLKPDFVVMNGDILDGATISRHPPIGWESRPTLIDELDVVKERLAEIEAAAKGAERIWTLGNHDGRFETKLAGVAPEYAKVHGVHLKDHFPGWRPCWSTWIGEAVIKHRMRGGVYAARNNTLNAGKTVFTGHDHRLTCMVFSDYNGMRFGVTTGTLANPYGPQFTDYTEDGVRDWQSGFASQRIRKGRGLPPQLAYVWGDEEVAYLDKVHLV